MATVDMRGSVPFSDRFTEAGHDMRGTVGAGAEEEPADVVAPVVSNVSPADGATLKSDTAIQFDVTDDSGSLSAVFISARYVSSGEHEVVHDGDQFATRFVALSTRTSISGGYRYTLRRSGGWPAAPNLLVKALDASGNST